MSPLEIKRLQLELVKIGAAKAELQFKIEERLEDIRRIEENIKLQEKRENELNTQITAAQLNEQGL